MTLMHHPVCDQQIGDIFYSSAKKKQKVNGAYQFTRDIKLLSICSIFAILLKF